MMVMFHGTQRSESVPCLSDLPFDGRVAVALCGFGEGVVLVAGFAVHDTPQCVR